MQPKFKVGEVVIRQAPHNAHPEANGERTVLAVVTKEQAELMGNVKLMTDADWFYKLDISVKFEDGSTFNYYSENYLFKKHQPGEMNFHSLMEWMKQPAKA